MTTNHHTPFSGSDNDLTTVNLNSRLSDLDAGISQAIASLLSTTVIGNRLAAGGGVSTAGSWVKRPLNFIEGNVSGLVSFDDANDRFTLQAGTWLIDAAFKLGLAENVLIRLYDVTNASAIDNGISANVEVAANNSSVTLYKKVIEVAAATTYQFEQYSTRSSSQGLGVYYDPDSMGEAETHTYIELLRLSP